MIHENEERISIATNISAAAADDDAVASTATTPAASTSKTLNAPRDADAGGTYPVVVNSPQAKVVTTKQAGYRLAVGDKKNQFLNKIVTMLHNKTRDGYSRTYIQEPCIIHLNVPTANNIAPSLCFINFMRRRPQ